MTAIAYTQDLIMYADDTNVVLVALAKQPLVSKVAGIFWNYLND